MTEIPESGPVGSTEMIDGPTPAGGVRMLLLKNEHGEIMEAQEIDADGRVIERTYFPPSSLDR